MVATASYLEIYPFSSIVTVSSWSEVIHSVITHLHLVLFSSIATATLNQSLKLSLLLKTDTSYHPADSQSGDTANTLSLS